MARLWGSPWAAWPCGVAAVLREEQLLERRLPAQQFRDPGVRQDFQQRGDRAAHVAADHPPVHLHRGHPGYARQIGDRAIEGGLDRERGEMPHLGQRSHLHELACPQDAHPVAERLHLAQDVRGEEHRLAAVASFTDALPERLLHQRIQPARRLVQDEQVGAGHQRGDQDDLLPVALGVGADLLGRIELEPRDQLVPVHLIDAPLDTAEELKGLGAGEGRPQVRLTGHERQAAVRLDGLAMAVEAEDLAPPLGRVDEPQQQADRRGLARPVGAQVTDHLTLGNLKIEVIEGCDAAVALRQPLRAYGGSSHSNCLPLASRWPGYTRV